MSNYSRARKEAKEEFQEFIRTSSYSQLEEDIQKCFRTTFIGALAKIEDTFGYLWGEENGEVIEEEDMDEEQKKYYDDFLNLRERILDQGNFQMKLAIAELKKYNNRRNQE